MYGTLQQSNFLLLELIEQKRGWSSIREKSEHSGDSNLILSAKFPALEPPSDEAQGTFFDLTFAYLRCKNRQSRNRRPGQ